MGATDPQGEASPARARPRDPWAAEILAIRDRADARAFAALFAHFAPRVRAHLVRTGSSPELAEDCAQEALATVWRKAHLFDPSRASAATWIFAVARNRRVDLVRRAKAPPESLPWGPEEPPAPPDRLARREDEARVALAVARLPPAQRAVVERAYWGDRSHGEIAGETGLPLGTVKSRLRLALGRLREALDAPSQPWGRPDSSAGSAPMPVPLGLESQAPRQARPSRATTASPPRDSQKVRP